MKLPRAKRVFARFATLRWRLTLFYCGLVAVLLAATGIFVYTKFSSAQRTAAVARLNDLALLFKPIPSKGTGMIGFILHAGDGAGGKLLPADLPDVKLRMEQGSSLDRVYAALVNADGTAIFSNQPLQISTVYSIEPETPLPTQNTGDSVVTYDSNLLVTSNMKFGPRTTEHVHGLVYAEPFWNFPQDPVPSRSTPPAGYLVVAIPIEGDQAALQQLSSFLLTGGVGALLAALLVGLPLARLGLRPLERIADTATAIGAGDLTRRVALPRHAVEGVGDEVRQLGETFNAMLDRIETSFAAQRRSEARTRQFAADASHELRSPITVLGGYIDVLLLGAKDDPAQSARILHAMQRENGRLGRLVTDLLLLTRMDANGAASLRLEPIPIGDLIKRACDNMRLLACDRSINPHISPAASCALVNGDGDQLYRVAVNLLDNAIRYTGEGGEISVELDCTGSSTPARPGGRVRLSVSDNGCGISESDLPHIFDRFYRADQSRDRQTGSAGLGLAICKSIVEAHCGSICVESTSGHGATFVVDLPIL